MNSYLSDRLLQFVFVIEEETRSHLFICLSVGQERLFSCEIENDKFHLPHHSYHYMNKGNWNTGTARNKPGLWLWTILTSVWNFSISIVSISIWFLSTSLRNSDDDELGFLSFSNAIVHGRGKEKKNESRIKWIPNWIVVDFADIKRTVYLGSCFWPSWKGTRHKCRTEYCCPSNLLQGL